MKLTKTWLSYIVWGFFSVIFFTNIGIAAIEIYIKNEMSDFLMPMLILYGGTIVGLLLFIGLYKLFEKYVLPKMSDETSVLKGVGEWIALAMVIFVASVVRVIAVIASTGQLEGTTLFYDYAIGQGGNELFALHNNGACLYGGFLGFILSFLGHIPNAAMGVQAGIQVVTIVITYFMLKKSLGRMYAWIAVVLLSFLPGSFMAVRTITPDALFTLFLVLFMWALVSLGTANREQKVKGNVYILLFILLGVFAAFLTYYDMVGIVAFVIGIVALAQYKNEDAWLKIQKPFLQILFYAFSYVVALFLMLWFLPTGGVEAGPASVMAYLSSFIPEGGLNLMIITPHKGQWDCVAIFIFAGLWFAGFLRTKADKGFPYAFLILFITVTSFVGIGSGEYTLFASFLWCVLAAIGLVSINDFRKNERDVAIAEKNRETTAKRKEERERRRAEATGEKSIRLDVVNHKKAMEEPALAGKNKYSGADESLYETPKKSYGVGRRNDTTASTASAPVYDNNANDNVVRENEIKTYDAVNTVNAVNTQDAVNADMSNQSVFESKTVVKKVDRPPLGMPTTTYPYQNNPNAVYTTPSRSRRSFRTPSKSTFTQEDLERISRYTGVSYMATQTVQPKVEETYPEITDTVEETIVETTVETVAETTGNNFGDGYIELASTTGVAAAVAAVSDANVNNQQVEMVEKTEQAESVQNNEQNDMVEAVQSAYVPNESITETEESVVVQDAMEEKTVETRALQETEKTEVSSEEETSKYKVYNPSRRHFRYPSKSTFSPEELERIREFTGMNVQAPVTTDKPEDALSTVKQDATVAASGTIGQRSVVRTITSSKPAESDDETVPVKQMPERKPKMIRNPLPGPKPHVARELNYDYVPKESEMDYDLKDLKGRDYFDI